MAAGPIRTHTDTKISATVGDIVSNCGLCFTTEESIIRAGITYTAWAGELPSRLTLNHAGVDGKAAVEIRLIIDQWKVGP